MSHYLIEQIALLDNVEVRTGAQAVAAEGEDAHLRRLRIRDADGSESVEEVDACFVFIGAAPRTDWLEGVVARDGRGFILAGPDVPADRLAAQARPVPAREQRAGRVRGRRRPRALDQARGERRRRGLDGGLADPRVPGGGMSVAVAELRGIDLFEELDDAELERWAAVATERTLESGDVLTEAGEHALGHVPARRHADRAADARRPARAGQPPRGADLARRDPGADRLDRRREDRRRGLPRRIAQIDATTFTDLTLGTRTVHARVMRQIRPVVGRITAMEASRDRLASLGTMAAGLAHELNNPAAAARRASQDLGEALDVLASTVARFVEAGMEREQAADLVVLQREALTRAAACTRLDALDAADAEDELEDALEALGVAEPWRMAEPLAAARLDRDWLDRVSAAGGPAAGDALAWVAASLTARGLAQEVGESTDRISQLVKAVKAYAYMDRGEMVEVDVHEGPRDDARRARPQAQAHDDRAAARVRPQRCRS